MGQRTPPKNFIQIPLGGGVDSKTDPAQVQPPKLLDMQNFSARSVGALTARYGSFNFTTLGLADTATVGATNDELLGADSGGLYGYNFETSQFLRRGDYTDMGLSVQNIINQAVNQNYAPNQKGGVRNLSMAIIGNVGMLVWDTGPATSSGMYIGGTVYLSCFDAVTGRVFWTTTTTGYCPTYAAGLYALHGTQTPSAFTVGSLGGATQPTVVAHSGKFIFSMITCTTSASVTASSTTTTGYAYIGNMFYMTPDGTTGVPPQPTINALSLSSITSMLTASTNPMPFNIMSAGTTVNSGAASLFETINHYYDLVTNGTDLTYVGSFASSNSSNALVYGNPTFFFYGWTDPTVAGAGSSAAANEPLQNGSSATGAQPVALASIAGVTTAGLCTNWGCGTVRTYSAGAGTRGTFSNYGVYNGKQNNTTPSTAGLAGWPAAITLTGTSSSCTMIVTDGYLVNQFAYNSGTVQASGTESYINLPMTSTRQVPMGPGLGQSTVASRMFWIPNATSGKNSGVVDPAVWLYVASPATGTNNAAYPGGVAPPGSGGGFNSFTNLVLARINLAAFSSSAQNVNLSEVVARCFYLKALPFRYGTMRPSNVISYNGGYAFPAMQLVNVADSIVATRLVTVKGGQQRNIIPLPQGALLTGADTRYYDGLTVRSAGWLRLPELGNTMLTATTQTGANLAANNLYTYYFVYTEYDNYGNAIYSSTSPPYSVTTLTGANNAVQIDTNEFWPAGSKSNTLPSGVQIFRNTSLNPLQYYRVAQIASVGATAQYGQQYYIDASADDISGNALLYSPPNGGELPNDPAPPSTCAAATKQRVYVASAENPSYVFPSKPFYVGRAPIEFNAAQYVDIDPSTGPVTGLSNLDDTLVVFKQKAIYLLSGDGPDATGVGQFNKPFRLSVDVGLQDPQSIVSTERGVFFRSQRGIELLDRGGASVTYVGAPVEAFLANTITSATIVPNQSQVRFINTLGNSLVYDYVSQIWLRYTLNTPNAVSTCAVYFNGALYTGYTTSSSGNVVQEIIGASANYGDGGNNFQQIVQTPYMPVAQNMHGWGRARRINILGRAYANATMVVRAYYDYDSNTLQNVATVPLTAGEFQVRVRTQRQVCQAISVLLTITPVPTNIQGPTISSIELETSVKSGSLRRPDTVSY